MAERKLFKVLNLVSSQACFLESSLVLFISDFFKKSLQNAVMRRFLVLSEVKIIATYLKSHT
jgi:hypothetical protein